MSEEKELFAKVLQLEELVRQKDQDLLFFKSELKKVNERIEKMIANMHGELKMTEKMQSLLIPTELPSISGFEFSTKFVPSLISGGDYFDIFNHSGKMKFAILMAGSSGYSASALLMTVLLKFSGMGWAQFDNSAENLTEIVKKLQKEMGPEDATSLFFAIIDRKNFSVDFSSAGKVLAYYYSSETNTVERMNIESNEVECKSTVKFENKEIMVSSNDKVIICSPGFLQVENKLGQKYNEDHIKKSIVNSIDKPVHELRNEVLYQSEKFSEGQEFKKDRTVIVFEVKNRVIKLARI